MRRFVLFFLLLTVYAWSGAQTAANWPKSLLWKISGNHLTKPSFLYGTMHLQDKRLFYFSDSLYHYLEQADGYAIEINLHELMDSVIQRSIDQKADEYIDSQREKPGDEKKTIDSLMRNVKEFNDKGSRKRLERMREEKIRKVTRKEMPTIMDAYLFGIAKRMGKWVGGVEDVQDQLAIYDEIGGTITKDELMTSETTLKRMMEEMVSMYTDQDLNKIEKYFSHDSGEKLQDLLFTRRNIKMARRMDSLSAIRTMFYAVGAAHLPGDSGVINLLRRKGYTVEPVISTQKIDPTKYISGLNTLPWIRTEDEKKTYSIEMPGEPTTMNIFGELFKMKVYVDITTLTFFMSGSTIAQNKIDPTTLMEKFSANVNGEIENKRIFEKDGAKVVEGVMTANGYYYKVQYYLKDKLLFLVMAGGADKAVLGTEDVKKYFQSFTMNKSIPVTEEKEWSSFSLSDKAFTVMLPGAPNENKTAERQAEGTNWSFKAYDYTDMASGKYYMVQVRDLIPGYYLTGDSAYFSLLKENFANGVKEVTREDTLTIQTFPAYRYDGLAKEGEYSLATLNINRGNRIYFLMAVGGGKMDNDPQVERFFNSFTMTDYPVSVWKKEWSPDHSFYSTLPSPVVQKEDSSLTAGNSSFVSFNAKEVISYQVYKELLPEYFWIENDSLLLDYYGRAYKGYQDSLLRKTSTVNGGLKGEEWLIKMPQNNNLKKVRQMLNGDTLYTIVSFIPTQYIERKDHRQFFDDFRVAKENPVSSAYTSKAAKLFIDLLSKDSATFAKASDAIRTASFSKADLPGLHTALTHIYRDDSDYYNTSNKISNVLKRLADSTTVDFIRSHFDSLQGDKEHIKSDLLLVLAANKTEYSYALLKELLLKHTPLKTRESFNFSYLVSDSLELAKKMFPEILELSKNTLFSQDIISISRDLLDSNAISIDMLRPYETNFLYSADTILQNIKKSDKENIGYYYNDYLHVLGKFNDEKSNKMLQQYLLANDVNVKHEALLILLGNKQPVDNKEIEKVAADRGLRKYLYSDLKEMGKVNLFPAKYKTQRYMAESEIHYYASDDYEPSKVIFVAEKTVMFKGKKQKFYLFKVVFDYEEDGSNTNAYLGITGPYSLSATNCDSDNSATGLIWDEEFDSKRVEELFKKHIAEAEKENDE